MFPTFQTPQVLKTVRTTEPSGSYYCYSPLNPNLAAIHDGRRSCDRPLNASVLTAPPAALTSVAAELAEDHHQPTAPGNESASDAPRRALGCRLRALPPRDVVLVPSGPGRSRSTSAAATATAATAVAATAAASEATATEADKPPKGTACRRACLRVPLVTAA